MLAQKVQKHIIVPKTTVEPGSLENTGEDNQSKGGTASTN